MKNSGIEWIGEIPDSWSIVLLSSLFKEHKEKNVGMKCNNLLSLSYGEIKRKNIDAVDGLLPESFEGYNVIDNGDIVLRLTDLQNDQRSLRTGLCHERGIVTSAYVTLRKRNPELNSEFLHYYLHSFDVRKGFYGMGSGVRQGLNFDGIRKLEILLPPTQVQERIVSFLKGKISQVDELIANQQGRIEKLKEYKQSVITEAVTKGLDKSAPLKDSGIDWIGEIPENWNVFQLKNISTIKTGHTPSTAHIENFNGNVNWYTPGDFVNETIENSSRKISEYALQNEGITLFPVNTTLLVGIGGTAGKVCRILVEGYSNQQITALMANDKVDPVYLFYELTASRRYLKDNAMYTTLPIINNGYLGSLKFVIPNIKTQKEIADYLDEKCGKIDEVISIKQRKIEKLQEYKKSLIYEYVTGKKEVV